MASHIRKSWINNPYLRIAGRVICGFGAIFFFFAPNLAGETWVNLFRTDPFTVFIALPFGLLNIYVAVGQPGINYLNRIFNRFDLEREITLTPEGVMIRRGTRIRQKKWSEFRSYFESSELYVLQTAAPAIFWTIPKRAFEPGTESIFAQLLRGNLRKKENNPYPTWR